MLSMYPKHSFFALPNPFVIFCHNKTCLNPQSIYESGRPGLPPIICVGCSNNNTAANSRLLEWAFKPNYIKFSHGSTIHKVTCYVTHLQGH